MATFSRDRLINPFRRILERVSRGVVLRRGLPSQFGPGKIFVSPEAGLKYCRFDYSRCEPVLFQMAVELVHEGDIIWDIGANVGLFAFAAAGRAGARGKVVAVEPDLWLVTLLRRSAAVKISSRAPVTVIPVAVADTLGLGHFHIAARARSANYLDGGGSTQSGGSRETEVVPTVTLDWLLEQLPAPTAVKIDVEGMEHRVLQGAEKLIMDVRPKIWCEVSEQNAEPVTELLRAAAYDIYNAADEPSVREPLRRAVWDTLACPQLTKRVIRSS
ncbi:MAG TPA: FkbM family methyltransferase [Terriglobales bacterium]|nr:FkbM family methyltransferase [Terriglobales bacterium]